MKMSIFSVIKNIFLNPDYRIYLPIVFLLSGYQLYKKGILQNLVRRIPFIYIRDTLSIGNEGELNEY